MHHQGPSKQKITHIIGVGTDIISISRINKILEESGAQQFIERILGKQEREHCLKRDQKKRVHYIAKRFAAKEAVAKALGNGIGKIAFKDIEILNAESGQPYVTFSNSDLAKNIHVAVSLTDDSNMAAAIAIAYQVEE